MTKDVGSMSRTVTRLTHSATAEDRRKLAAFATGGKKAKSREHSDLGGFGGREDAASLMGIPVGEISPRVQTAILKIVKEMHGLHEELDRARQRITQLTELADRDALTPLLNRRAFERELARALSYAGRYGAPSSLVFFDVNNMKQINDRFGHQAGDAALVHLARIMLGQVRKSDVVGRLGGDEFGVILAQSDRARAEQKARELTRIMASTPLIFEGRPLSLRVAHGVHHFQDHDTAEDVLKAADQAMYADKQGVASGR